MKSSIDLSDSEPPREPNYDAIEDLFRKAPLYDPVEDLYPLWNQKREVFEEHVPRRVLFVQDPDGNGHHWRIGLSSRWQTHILLLTPLSIINDVSEHLMDAVSAANQYLVHLHLVDVYSKFRGDTVDHLMLEKVNRVLKFQLALCKANHMPSPIQLLWHRLGLYPYWNSWDMVEQWDKELKNGSGLH